MLEAVASVAVLLEGVLLEAGVLDAGPVGGSCHNVIHAKYNYRNILVQLPSLG